ncbi:MAG: hypothetical protein EHM19_08960 [Candidatus Latescibacterota bacterium]|nr:MAG: hypothetical protein EHM19_08960 [Candidatus Latescibacterota bacterium]
MRQREIFGRRPARSRELEQVGVSRTQLRQLLERGLLERVGRGLYRLPGTPITERRHLAEAACRQAAARDVPSRHVGSGPPRPGPDHGGGPVAVSALRRLKGRKDLNREARRGSGYPPRGLSGDSGEADTVPMPRRTSGPGRSLLGS